MAPAHFSFLPPAFAARTVILVLALLLDAAIGDPKSLYRRVPHPVTLIGAAIGFLDTRLNRFSVGARQRRVRGILAVLALGGGAIALGLGLTWLFSARYGWIGEVVVVSTLLAQRSLFDHVREVATGLDQGGIEAGRAAVRHIVGRDPEALDRFGVARAAIESLAENFSDGVVAPVLFYLAGGLPGILLCKTVNTADSIIGHMNLRYRNFGWAAARLDDLCNLIPARIAALLIAAGACFIPDCHPWEALSTAWRDARKHASPNAGWPEAALAGAAGLALGGPKHYGGISVAAPWLGSGRAQATTADIWRALFIYVVAGLVEVGVLCGFAVVMAR